MAQKEPREQREVFEKIEGLIRTGNLLDARKLISEALPQTWARRHPQNRRRLAEFCRRVGWQEQAIRLLNPVVRPTGKKPDEAEPADIVEYAANLTFIGAAREALELLSSDHVRGLAKARLFRGFAHFSRWEYAPAVPLLEEYCQDTSLTDYEQLIGEVNLLSAYVNSHRPDLVIQRSETVLQRLSANTLLWMNVLEIRAQALIQEQRYDEALRALNLIRGGSQVTGTSYGFFVDKWSLVLDLHRNGASRPRLEKLKRLTQQALQSGRWEVARDCDFHRALFSQNRRLARHLYFGTPYAAYREKIRERLELSIEPGESYQWNPLGAPAAEDILDVALGQPLQANLKRNEILKPGQLPHRLLKVLCSDFYRPQKGGALFAELFPGEHYHPIYSARKTHQVILRLRAWLKTHVPGLSLPCKRSLYSLACTDPVGLLVRLDDGNLNDKFSPLLRAMIVGRPYSLDDLAGKLKLPRRTLQRQLSEATSQGQLQATGSTRDRRYVKLK